MGTDKFGRIVIKDLDDLEIAGVLASAGYLNSVVDLYIHFIDVTNVPINIVNSLAKVVEGTLYFKKVTGLCFTMLEEIKSDEFRLHDMPAPTQMYQDISVNGRVTLNKISSDVSGFLDKLTCDDLEFHDMKLDNSVAQSLTLMLDRRVKNVNYDGQGQCESMFFEDETDSISSIKEHLAPWAASKRWNVIKDNLTLFEIKRTIREQ